MSGLNHCPLQIHSGLFLELGANQQEDFSEDLHWLSHHHSSIAVICTVKNRRNFIYLCLNIFFLRGLYAAEHKIYYRCMRQNFTKTDFNNLPEYHPFLVFSKMAFFIPTILVPFLYWRIYYFRKSSKHTGTSHRKMFMLKFCYID